FVLPDDAIFLEIADRKLAVLFLHLFDHVLRDRRPVGVEANAKDDAVVGDWREMEELANLRAEIIRRRNPEEYAKAVVAPFGGHVHILPRQADTISRVSGLQNEMERQAFCVQKIGASASRSVHDGKMCKVDSVLGKLLDMHRIVHLEPGCR